MVSAWRIGWAAAASPPLPFSPARWNTRRLLANATWLPSAWLR